jgi:hypothetical protein
MRAFDNHFTAEDYLHKLGSLINVQSTKLDLNANSPQVSSVIRFFGGGRFNFVMVTIYIIAVN